MNNPIPSRNLTINNLHLNQPVIFTKPYQIGRAIGGARLADIHVPLLTTGAIKYINGCGAACIKLDRPLPESVCEVWVAEESLGCLSENDLERTS